MNEYVKFHHHGLAVKTFNEAISFHKNLGYSFTDEVYDELQNVMLMLCTSKEFPSMELVKPVNDDNPINIYLKIIMQSYIIYVMK